MSDIAIRVENLSKRYHIGRTKERHDTLRDALVSAVRAPLDRLRRRADHGSRTTDDDDDDDTIWALKDVSFEIKRGEVVGVIGRNGAGKSTLLKILSRITEPTSGRAEIHGRVGSLLEVGTGFHPELTGRENVYLSGAILGMRRAEIDRKFDEIVDFSGVEKFIDTPVKRYSSGMRVRLGFAVAAHLNPEILLVDEVLAVGDVAFQKRCLGKMEDVARSGRTVLFVSHNMAMIRSLCERAILLEIGEVDADGNPHDVVRKYLASWNSRGDNGGEIVWRSDEAPGSKEIHLCSIRLLDQDGKVKSDFTVDEPIMIEVAYQVNETLRGTRAVVHLTTEEGEIAFASTDHAQRPNVLQPGVYKTALTVPGGLLNSRQYFVQVHFGIPGMRVLIPKQEYLSFTCILRTVEGPYGSEHWPGVLAPHLEWSCEQLD